MKSKHIALLFRVYSNGWGERVGRSSPLIMMLITLRPLFLPSPGPRPFCTERKYC